MVSQKLSYTCSEVTAFRNKTKDYADDSSVPRLVTVAISLIVTTGDGVATGYLLQWWSTLDSTFFVSKTLHEYIDSLWNIDSIRTTHNVTSSQREKVSVWRWSNKLNGCRKERKGNNSKHAPYSPDLAPCNFHVFGKNKEHLAGRQFSNDGQIQTAIRIWLWDKAAMFYSQGIERLVERSEKVSAATECAICASYCIVTYS